MTHAHRRDAHRRRMHWLFVAQLFLLIVLIAVKLWQVI